MTARCRRRGRAVGALLVTLALGAGCTGGGDEGAPETTAGTTTPTTRRPDRTDDTDDTDDPGPTPLGFAGIALAEGTASSAATPAAAVVAGRAARRRRRRRGGRPAGAVGATTRRRPRRSPGPPRRSTAPLPGAPMSRSRRPSRWRRRQRPLPPSRSCASSPRATSASRRSSPSRSTSRWCRRHGRPVAGDRVPATSTPAIPGTLAVDRHPDAALRRRASRRPPADGHRLHRRGAGRHAVGERR